MVLHKRLDYGFNGYQVPSFPRASRSARGKCLSKSKAEDKQMLAFELLATVAGSLSRKGEDSESQNNVVDERVQAFIVNDIVDEKQQDEEKTFGPCDPGSSDESVFVSDFGLQRQLQNKNGKELPAPKHVTVLEDSSVIAESSFPEKLEHNEAVTGQKTEELMRFLCKTEGGSSGYGDPRGNGVDGIGARLDSEIEKGKKNNTSPKACSSESPMELDVKPPTFVNMDNSIEVPHTSSFPFQTDIKLVCKDDDEKDDDENSSRCTHPHTGNLKAFRPQPRIAGRRIRRLLASKYWKVSRKLNGRELSNSGTRHVFRNTKACYSLQRPRRNSNFRRKLFKHRLTSQAEEGTRNDHLFKSSKDNKVPTGSASRESAQESFSSRDSRVRLSIKSFRVPELFIEIPETATVGSLKRTVREAVSAILAGGLCVGVVLQGKKVKDDNKTLHQTGISHDDKLDALGFMLEPNPSPVSTPMSPPQSSHQEDSPVLVSCDLPQPLDRYLKIPVGDPLPSDATSSPRLTNAVTLIENGVDAVPSPVAMIAEKSGLDSRTLIASPKSVEALAVVPLHRKSRKSELSQRRIRRPFSVSEVEALVQAVEKLGTGRWRDVKHWAFDDANHRTYVDLKDKWKTLVHTAKIAPQQRRGEPVPQELLDRVLAAHAHWSQQAKQHVKQQTEPCFHLF